MTSSSDGSHGQISSSRIQDVPEELVHSWVPNHSKAVQTRKRAWRCWCGSRFSNQLCAVLGEQKIAIQVTTSPIEVNRQRFPKGVGKWLSVKSAVQLVTTCVT